MDDGGGVEVGQGGQELHHIAAHAGLRVGRSLAQPHEQRVPADSGSSDIRNLLVLSQKNCQILLNFVLSI